MPSTVGAHRIPTNQRPTSTAVPLVAIPCRADRQTHGRVKVSEAGDSRQDPWTAAVGNRRDLWTGAPAVQTARAAGAAIKLATEAYRQAPAQEEEEEEHLPGFSGGSKVVLERAVRGTPPA
jgi:hypothetical protein